MLKKYYLMFDNKVRYGSPEHYSHFLWGYLLPALNEVINIESDVSSKRVSKIFLFRSCGPVMNKLINEMLSLYNCSYEIIENNTLNADDCFTKIIVPRWDVWLRDFSMIKHWQFTSTTLKYILKNILLKNLFLILLKQTKFKSDFLTLILNVKTNTFHKIDKVTPVCTVNLDADSYLILKRSPQPKYYENGGKAEISTYGTDRRELIGIKNAVKNLRNNNIPVKIFEPGKHTLVEQIKAFQNCKGIVGIKGAEFANLIWMKPKSKVILIRPINFNPPPVQNSLANILGLNYFEITTKEGMYPTLNADLILKYLI